MEILWKIHNCGENVEKLWRNHRESMEYLWSFDGDFVCILWKSYGDLMEVSWINTRLEYEETVEI